MKSIELIVPRKLIKGFYPHPEIYGDFIVELQNGMITDVYYREEGEFITITNEDDLIVYLTNFQSDQTLFKFKNGVFALRDLDEEDSELLQNWIGIKPSKCTRVYNSNVQDLNYSQIDQIRLIATYYWIEIGIVLIQKEDNNIRILFENYGEEYFNGLSHDIQFSNVESEIFLDLIAEYIKKKLLK